MGNNVRNIERGQRDKEREDRDESERDKERKRRGEREGQRDRGEINKREETDEGRGGRR